MKPRPALSPARHNTTMKFFRFFAAILLAASADPSFARETHTKRIEFPKGNSHTMVTGHVAGTDFVSHKLNARS